MNFDNLTILGSKNGIKKVAKKSVREKQKPASKRKNTIISSTTSKPKLRKTRTKKVHRINSDVELGKPCYPYGYVYNYFVPHETHIEKLGLPNYNEFNKDRELFTGLGLLSIISDEELLRYLKSYRFIVLKKVQHYLKQRMSVMCGEEEIKEVKTETIKINFNNIVKTSYDLKSEIGLWV